MNRSDKKRILWNVIGVIAGICLAIYILVLLYYNPYYHYETFLKKEWFFIISAVIVGGIFSFFIIDTLYQERYIDEDDNIIKNVSIFLYEGKVYFI
jgi:RsiW-degrading membrane proteinase PrsW (M82 family)